VKELQHAYIAALRKDKPAVALRCVLMVRKKGGRFLKKHKEGDVVGWKDIGNSRCVARSVLCFECMKLGSCSFHFVFRMDA